MASVHTGGCSKPTVKSNEAARCVPLLRPTRGRDSSELKKMTLETATRTLSPCHLGSDDLFVSLLVEVPASLVGIITWQWSAVLTGLTFPRRKTFYLSRSQDLIFKRCLWSGEGAEFIPESPV